MSARKIVIVLGATGAGKSKLAIQIATKYNGEIISTDSMQIYKGLDIITNKVTDEEQRLVPHHMLDFVSPLRSDFNVVDFRNAALPKISDMFERKKLPVIVGGTNYYIESLLWDLLIEKPPDNVATVSDNNEMKSSLKTVKEEYFESTSLCTEKELNYMNTIKKEDKINTSGPASIESERNKLDFDDRVSFVAVSTRDLHQRLKEIDPTSAKITHPHDRRKIMRALEVYNQHATPLSKILEDQHRASGGSCVSGPLRYPDACVIWVKCDQNVLDERTDQRVHQMVERGLVAELEEFHQQYNQQRIQEKKDADYEHGVFQSIGFKEFHNYLLLTSDQRKTPDGQKLLEKGIEDMKCVTRRYARKQQKWIVNRFLKRRGLNVPPVYSVDSTEKEQWDTSVYKPASDIVQDFLNNKEPDQAPLPVEESNNKREQNICEVCDLVFVNTNEWQAHLNGRKHKKKVASIKKQEKKVLERNNSHSDGELTDPKKLRLDIND